MAINRKLNFVMPVEVDDNGSKIFCHTIPLSAEALDQYWEVIGQTFAAIYESGMSWHTGPRYAYKFLEQIARGNKLGEPGEGIWPQVQAGLVAEMRRLTTAIIPGKDSMLLDEAVRKQLITKEDELEVMSAITFFIVNSATLRGEKKRQVLKGAAFVWDAQITSLDNTAFANSLPTSTKDESSGAKVE